MSTYLTVKLLHILASVVLAGAAGGIALMMYLATRSKNAQAIAVTARSVVTADWVLTAPALAIVYVTGIWLMKHLGYAESSLWNFTVTVLFVFIVLCWAPVVMIQYKLREITKEIADGAEADENYDKLMRWWLILGVPGFLAVMDMFWIMVFKPFDVM